MQIESSTCAALALCVFCAWLGTACLDNDVEFNPTDAGADVVATETDGGEQSPSDTGSTHSDTPEFTGDDAGESCTPTNGGEEACDGQDNDCDGEVDEELTKACGKQDGVCENAVVACTDGEFPECGEDEYGENWEAQEMSCDGKDNDCDGVVDRDGQCSFTEFYDTTAGEIARDVATTGDGKTFYVTGTVFGNSSGFNPEGNSAGFLAKYNQYGKREWIEYIDSDGQDMAFAVAVDHDLGGAWVAGTHTGVLDQHSVDGGMGSFAAHFGPEGIRTGFKFLDSPGEDGVTDIAVDSRTGDLYLVGGSSKPSLGHTRVEKGSGGVFVAKIDEKFGPKWIEFVDGESFDGIGAVTVNEQFDVVYYTAYRDDDSGNEVIGKRDIVVGRCKLSGGCRLVDVIGSSAEDSLGDLMTHEPSGMVLVAGGSDGDFEGEANTGGTDAFVAAFEYPNGLKWATLHGGPGDEKYAGLAAGKGSRVAAVGTVTAGFSGETYVGGPTDLLISTFPMKTSPDGVRIIGGPDREVPGNVIVAPDRSVWIAGASLKGLKGTPARGMSQAFIHRQVFKTAE